MLALTKSNRTSSMVSSSTSSIGIEEECISQVWPLRTESDYRKAQEIVDKLAVKGEENLSDTEKDQLEVFGILMEKYEEDHYSIEPLNLTPIEFLQLLLRENSMSESDLGRLLGDRTLGHKILKGTRRLSRNHVRVLGEYFRVDFRTFL